MDESLQEEVWRRAGSLCEYCRMPSDVDPLCFQIDHIIAKKHDGQTLLDNLALSCFHCNSHKGPNIAGINPETRQVVPLFHPRRDRWNEHFRWEGPILIGRTAVGQATIKVLAINHVDYVAFRRALIDEGVFPPAS